LALLRRQEHRGEQRDHRDDDQQLDQGESIPVGYSQGLEGSAEFIPQQPSVANSPGNGFRAPEKSEMRIPFVPAKMASPSRFSAFTKFALPIAV
jgi:hypothetical protein